MNEALLPVLSIAVAVVLAPGPNNFIVMTASANGGVSAALKPAMAILLGTSILIMVSFWGLSVLVTTNEMISLGILLAGAAYLLWMGFSLIKLSLIEDETISESLPLPLGFIGITTFQFLNPKAWLVVTTSASAVMNAGGNSFDLAAVLLGASVIGLSLWSMAGASVKRFLSAPSARRKFHLSMGSVLALSSLALLWQGFSEGNIF